jgi:flagellar hook protein FlgE
MRLESALFSGRESLLTHGQAISVVGDNVANSNTTGYKTSRPEFADLVAAGESGGTDSIPSGGNGVRISDVRQINEGGALEGTGRALDAAIDGTGFFLVGDSAAPQYSRAGNFYLDADGELANSDGKTVLGFTEASPTTLTTLNLLDVDVSAVATTNAAIVANLDSRSDVTTVPTNPASFSEIAEAANFTSDVEVFDSLGGRHNLRFAYYKTDTNAWTVQSYLDGADVGGTAGTPSLLGTATMAFDATGDILEADQAAAQMVITPAYGEGAAAGNITLNFASFRQQAAPFALQNVTQDGQSTGDVQGYSIEDDGRIVATLSSGDLKVVGTIALATFANVDGLKRIGSNTYEETGSVGEKTVATASTRGLGTLKGATLERSNVDLAISFTDLIGFQRGYQAASQVLTAANELIRQTIDLMR